MEKKTKSDFYLPDPGLKAAVEVARDLNMPLLVTGEPGTGKTKLADWIAGPEMLNSRVFRFNTKTTSIAKDLFYRYDAIRHFGDRESNPMRYIHLEAFGLAVFHSTREYRPVVLIDEIDKAPRDFPNDVLYEFEEFAFRIEEATIEDIKDYNFAHLVKGLPINIGEDGYIRLPEEIPPPFLLLTSNSEKNLPEAFLRRCIFYHISFPDKELLLKIVKAKSKASKRYENHLDKIVEFFLNIRGQGVRKPPATAELINWIESLKGRDIDWEELDKGNKKMRLKLEETLPVLVKNTSDFHTTKENIQNYFN